MAFGESKMKGAPNGHLMWRVWGVGVEWRRGHSEFGTLVMRCCAAAWNDGGGTKKTEVEVAYEKKQRQRRANSMQTNGKKKLGGVRGDKGLGEVAECQAYADGEMLALLKAIKWNYNLIVINNSEDSLSGVENSLRGCESLSLQSKIRATRKYARNVCMPTHSPYPYLYHPSPPTTIIPGCGPPSPRVRLL